MRRCPDCGQVKDIIDFGWRTGSDRVRAYCKPCMVIRTKRWVDDNRERYREYQREYRRRSA